MITPAQYADAAASYNLEDAVIKSFVAIANIKAYAQLCFVLDEMKENKMLALLRKKDWMKISKQYFGETSRKSIVHIRLENAYDAFRKVAHLNTLK